MDLLKDNEKILNKLKNNIQNFKNKSIYTFKNKKYKLTLARATLNSMIMSVLPDDLKNEKFLFLEVGSSSNLNDYIQSIADECYLLYENNIEKIKKIVIKDYVGEGEENDLKDINDFIRDIIYVVKEKINEYTLLFDFELSIDISMYDFLGMMRKSKRMYDILGSDNYNDNMSAYNVIQKKEKLADELEDFVIKNKVEPFYTFLTAEASMRLPQFHDICLGIGLRPYEDSLYPHIIKESWLRGIRTKESFWVENDSARHALIIQKLHISDTGVFNKYLTMISQESYLHPDPDYMCDTIHFVNETIYDEKDFERFTDLYMMDNGRPRLITKDDTHLIGKTIQLRQPLTCNSEDGVCRYCVGHNLYFDNLEGYAGGERNLCTLITKRKVAPKVQSYLSAKHNNIANIFAEGKRLTEIYSDNEVDWTDYFELKKLNNICFKKPVSEIYFFEPNLRENRSKKIELVLKNNKHLFFETDTAFYTVDDNLKEVKKNKKEVEKFKVININEIYLKIKNSPVSAGYNELNKVFNKPDDIQDIVVENEEEWNTGNLQKAMIELKKILHDDKAIIPYMLIRGLVRDGRNPEKRPDFSKDNPSIELKTMLTSIKKFPEVGLKLNIGYFKDALANVKNYKKSTTKSSKFDVLFESRQKKKVYDEEDNYYDFYEDIKNKED